MSNSPVTENPVVHSTLCTPACYLNDMIEGPSASGVVKNASGIHMKLRSIRDEANNGSSAPDQLFHVLFSDKDAVVLDAKMSKGLFRRSCASAVFSTAFADVDRSARLIDRLIRGTALMRQSMFLNVSIGKVRQPTSTTFRPFGAIDDHLNHKCADQTLAYIPSVRCLSG